MSDMSTNNDFDVSLARAMGSETFWLGHASVALYASDVPISRSTLLADLEAAEATFPGYVRKSLVLTDATFLPDGGIGLKGGIGITPWSPGNDTFGGENIYGAFVIGGGGVLVAAGRFDNAPVAMMDTLSTLSVTINFADRSAAQIVCVD